MIGPRARTRRSGGVDSLTDSDTRGLRRTYSAHSAAGDGTSQKARPSQSYQSGTLAVIGVALVGVLAWLEQRVVFWHA